MTARLNGKLLGEMKPISPPKGTIAAPTTTGLLAQGGRSRTRTPSASMWLQIDIDPGQLAIGNNLVELPLSGLEKPVSWDELDLVLRYR